MQSEKKKEEPNPRLEPLVDEYVYVYQMLAIRINNADPEALARLTIAIISHSRLWKA